MFGIPLRDVALVLAGAVAGFWLATERTARRIKALTAAIYWLRKPR